MREVGNHLLELFEQLPGQLLLDEGHPRHVPARPCEARDQPQSKWIASDDNDRDCLRSVLPHHRGGPAAPHHHSTPPSDPPAHRLRHTPSPSLPPPLPSAP